MREITDDLCLLERAVELKIEVEDQDVDDAIGRLREQNQIKDDAAFAESLKIHGHHPGRSSATGCTTTS